ncbi:protein DETOXIFICATION 21 [Ziziphus jujuba]|uniref:Protein DETOXIFICATION n=1 Tax=Ziziphus jujuba TaxID=326968 RepID=A0ABM3I779_ZIZJJ|nr:protein DETOXIFICATION 21 [Ziziphus jujuba]
MEEEINKRLLVRGEIRAEDIVDEEVSLKEAIRKESKKIWIVAAPAIFTRFSNFGLIVISQAFIGRIGSTELAGYALVFSVIVKFSTGILLGMSSALQTLCGQAYGARQYHMLGVYLQRSWIVLFFSSICILPSFIYTAPILKFLGQEEKISEMAGYIALWFIPILFAYGVSLTCQMFLQAQSKNMIIGYLAAFSTLFHLILSWLLTVKFKFGIPGAMASIILANWIPNLGQLMFIMWGGCGQTWNGFSSLAFKDLWLLVKLFVSSGVMICVEAWYNTVLVLLTGKLKNAEVSIDALSICLNIDGWELMISLGFMAAASVRVSNELGRGSSRAAKFSIVMTLLTSLAIGFVLFLIFLFLRGNLVYIFTESKDVAKAVSNLSSLLALSLLLNSVQPVISGVAVGAGWQSTLAYVNLACYYLIGIPVGLVLGYLLNMQSKGVWTGMLLGTFVQTVVIVIVTWKTDWDKQVTLARNRVINWLVADNEGSNPKTSETFES